MVRPSTRGPPPPAPPGTPPASPPREAGFAGTPGRGPPPPAPPGTPPASRGREKVSIAAGGVCSQEDLPDACQHVLRYRVLRLPGQSRQVRRQQHVIEGTQRVVG